MQSKTELKLHFNVKSPKISIPQNPYISNYNNALGFKQITFNDKNRTQTLLYNNQSI